MARLDQRMESTRTALLKSTDPSQRGVENVYGPLLPGQQTIIFTDSPAATGNADIERGGNNQNNIAAPQPVGGMPAPLQSNNNNHSSNNNNHVMARGVEEAKGDGPAKKTSGDRRRTALVKARRGSMNAARGGDGPVAKATMESKLAMRSIEANRKANQFDVNPYA